MGLRKRSVNLADRVRTLVNDVSKWSEALENSLPAAESRVTHRNYLIMGRGVPSIHILDDIGLEQLILGYYKVARLTKNGGPIRKGQRVRNPDFEVGWCSRIARDLGVLFPGISPCALPTSVWSIDRTVQIKSTTVSKDPDGNERPDAFRSGKVDCITGWAE